jgi:3-hydroxyacyl-[acyl-carrier-protein] dehydratase
MRFLFVDRILSLTPGERVCAVRTVPHDDDYFEDHFPGFPVVPGVLLTESMGQAAAKCLDAERRGRGKAMLARILSASFRQWVRPGDELRLSAEIVSNQERSATAECRAEVAGQVVAQARLLFSFVPVAGFAAGYSDRVLEAFLAGRVDE